MDKQKEILRRFFKNITLEFKKKNGPDSKISSNTIKTYIGSLRWYYKTFHDHKLETIKDLEKKETNLRPMVEMEDYIKVLDGTKRCYFNSKKFTVA